MPEVVQRCYESWQKHNAAWEIIFLDANNLQDYIDIADILENRKSEIPRVSVSELVRINLMKKHGGVWVDATCFCLKPLEDWLYEHLVSGFFAFNRPGMDRMLSSWFLAALPNNKLASTYADTANSFWNKHKRLNFVSDKKNIHKLIRRSGLYRRVLRKNPPLWFNFFFQKVLGIYPYYWFHYTFEKLYRTDKEVQKIWDDTPKISADIPHLLWNHGLDKPIVETIKERIPKEDAPLYKLTWKVNAAMFEQGKTLHYLLYKSGL